MRKPPANPTGAQRKAIAAAYQAGEPVKVIAHRFGIHQTTVTRIATALGVRKRYFGRHNALALGLAAVRLGLSCNDLELLAQLRGNPPRHGGPDRYEGQQASI